jgi:hypothetical protein
MQGFLNWAKYVIRSSGLENSYMMENAIKYCCPLSDWRKNNISFQEKLFNL